MVRERSTLIYYFLITKLSGFHSSTYLIPKYKTVGLLLVPMAEIAPTYVHPVLHKTILQLLAECADPLDVKKI